MLSILLLSLITLSFAFPQLPIKQNVFLDKQLRKISTAPDSYRWMNEQEIFEELIQKNVNFMDITDGDDQFEPRIKQFPTETRQQEIVTPLYQNISTDRMLTFLEKFSSFHTRYYKSSSGAESSKWLFETLENLIDTHADSSKVSTSLKQVKHTGWDQFSIILRLEAVKNTTSTKKHDIVILTAHQDSVNQWNPWFGRSPGADDDGSGTTTVLETLTILLSTGFVPKRPIEFHWYSAEEGGLLGSQQVAGTYRNNDIDVFALLHIDMDAYDAEDRGKKEVIGIGTDNVDPALNQFFETLIQDYLQIPAIKTQCGYACSDHASWTKNGYPAVFPFETPFDDHNPYIHTSDDTIEHVCWDHVHQFVQLALAFVIEMSLH